MLLVSSMIYLRDLLLSILSIHSDIYSIDKDNYTVYAMRVFKLGPSAPVSNPNNDFSVSRMFSINLTKHFKKFEWKDDGGAIPSSPNNLYMIFVGCYADNTPITFGLVYGSIR